MVSFVTSSAFKLPNIFKFQEPCGLTHYWLLCMFAILFSQRTNTPKERDETNRSVATPNRWALVLPNISNSSSISNPHADLYIPYTFRRNKAHGLPWVVSSSVRPSGPSTASGAITLGPQWRKAKLLISHRELQRLHLQQERPRQQGLEIFSGSVSSSSRCAAACCVTPRGPDTKFLCLFSGLMAPTQIGKGRKTSVKLSRLQAAAAWASRRSIMEENGETVTNVLLSAPTMNSVFTRFRFVFSVFC